MRPSDVKKLIQMPPRGDLIQCIQQRAVSIAGIMIQIDFKHAHKYYSKITTITGNAEEQYLEISPFSYARGAQLIKPSRLGWKLVMLNYYKK